MSSSVSQFKAVWLALAGYTCWVFADTCLKIVGATRLPVYEVIALVGLAEVLLLLVLGLLRRDVRVLWPKQPMRQVLRASLDVANNVFVVIALRHLPLALFYIMVFLAPMTTTVLAAIWLGERLVWKQGIAIVAGFLGVVLAVNPFAAARPGDWTGYLACLVCVACFSTNMVWSRKMTQRETPESLTFFSGLMQAVVGGGAMLWHAAPVSAGVGATLMGTGVCCVVGSICYFVALKHTTAANVSQYHYSQLLTGSLVAYLIWRERLTPWMVVGAAVIVAAGGYTAAAAYGARRASVVEDGLGMRSGQRTPL